MTTALQLVWVYTRWLKASFIWQIVCTCILVFFVYLSSAPPSTKHNIIVPTSLFKTNQSLPFISQEFPFLPEFITHLPVTWWKSCLSISPSRELAPILNKLGCVQSSPSSSFIKESHVKASLALRIPPAGLKPTLWPVCWNEKQNCNFFSWKAFQSSMSKTPKLSRFVWGTLWLNSIRTERCLAQIDFRHDE